MSITVPVRVIELKLDLRIISVDQHGPEVGVVANLTAGLGGIERANHAFPAEAVHEVGEVVLEQPLVVVRVAANHRGGAPSLEGPAHGGSLEPRAG